MNDLSARINRLWRHLSPLPGGRWLFSRMIGRIVPYTETIRATVIHLEPGHVRVQLADRRRVRNHLSSIHAIALVNLGEISSGLAVMAALPPGARGIVKGLSVDFIKKARGTLVAECRTTVPPLTDSIDHPVVATITDASGDEVARLHVIWRLSSR